MRIRAGTLADVPAIRRIAHAAWPVAYGSILSPEQLRYMLDRMYAESSLRLQMSEEGHRFLLAVEGDDILGFAAFGASTEGAGLAKLHKLYVLPEHKGSGLGKALLDAVMNEAAAAGHTALRLNVNRFNPSKRFYERQGFTVVREEVLDIGQGFVMDDHVMERSLLR
jgi:diamine N-acetyltransferase